MGLRVAYVLASGPSLGFDEYADVRRVEETGEFTIAVNLTIFDAPFADICYAWDRKFWEHYHEAIKKFPCRRVSAGANCKAFGVEAAGKTPREFGEDRLGGNNSGHQAINLAYLEGATEIVLLGFDCQHTDGKRHHHEDYGAPFKNVNTCKNWLPGFTVLAHELEKRGGRVVNCSRETSLDCFPRMTLEEYLGG